MNKSLICTFFLLCLFFSSCITNRDIVYLQEDNTIVNDSSVLREMVKPYRVQVGDILRIGVKALDKELTEIFNPSDLGGQDQGQSGLYFTGFTIDIHGRIEFPILGEIKVLDMTLEEIEDKVEKLLLEKYFKETAQIFVTVKLPGLNYSVVGEVKGGGSKVIYKERVNIIEAITNAGDILNTGDRKDVLVIRQYPDKQRIHHIDLTTIDAMQSPYYYIQPNDMILVKPLKRKALGAGQTAIQTISTIASLLSVLISTYFLAQNLK